MGSALLRGWIEAFPSTAFHIVTPHPEKVAATFPNAHFYASASALHAHAPLLEFDIGILAIKPKIAFDALPAYRPLFKKTHLLISLLAGTSISTLNKHIDHRCPLLRAMPNLGAAAQQSATVMYGGPDLADTHKNLATAFFNGVGKTFWVHNEKQFDQAMIAVGCGPGLIYKLLAHFQEALLPLGFEEEEMQDMLKAMLKSANGYAQQNNQYFEKLAAHLGKEGSYTHKGLTAANPALEKATQDFVTAIK